MSPYPVKTAAFGEVLKSMDRSHDTFIDCDDGDRIIGLNMR